LFFFFIIKVRQILMPLKQGCSFPPRCALGPRYSLLVMYVSLPISQNQYRFRALSKKMLMLMLLLLSLPFYSSPSLHMLFHRIDYVGQELTERQNTEWQNVVDTLEELQKLDDIIAEVDGEDEEDLAVEVRTTCEVGDANEFEGEGLDATPPSTPYDQAPALAFEIDSWAFERPTFLHLNTAQIQSDAEMLKAEFVDAEVQLSDILRFESRQYIDLNPEPAAPLKDIKIILKFFANDLGLDAAAEEKLVALVGTRYDPVTGEVRLVSARYPTAEMNKEYLKVLLTRLVREAKVPQ
jgi:hypothetical protein